MKKQISLDNQKKFQKFSKAKIADKQLSQIKGGDGSDDEDTNIITEEEIIA